MPANLVKTAKDEARWEAAKKDVGSKGGKSDRHWKLVVGLFQKIKRQGRKKAG